MSGRIEEHEWDTGRFWPQTSDRIHRRVKTAAQDEGWFKTDANREELCAEILRLASRLKADGEVIEALWSHINGDKRINPKSELWGRISALAAREGGA